MSFSYPPPLGESSGREFDGYGCGRVGKTRLEGGDGVMRSLRDGGPETGWTEEDV
jgi:hypothetical protein